MIEKLDIRTIALLTTLLCYVYGVGLILFSNALTGFKGLKTLGSGLLLLGTGTLLIAYRDLIPVSLSVIAANLLMSVGVMLIPEGLARFHAFKSHLRWIGPALQPLLLALFWYYTYERPDVNQRVIVISLVLAIEFLICAYIVAKNLMVEARTAQLLIMSTVIASAAFFIFRALWSVQEVHLKNFMNAGFIHSFAFLALQMIVMILGFCLIWLISATLQKRLHDLASIDPLTGLLNRRGLQDQLAPLRALIARDSKPLSLILTDIDHFKEINDASGHQAGDHLLRQLSMLLREERRAGDLVSRHGGEEFLIALPNTALLDASRLAERLRQRLERHAFDLHTGKPINITMSFGLSEALDGETWDEQVRRADEALYQAKRAGRNRVVCASATSV